MTGRLAALVWAAVAAVVVNFAGVVFFFRPIAEGDAAAGPLLPPALGFLVYIALSVLALDWVSRQIGGAVRAGLVVALGQILLLLDLVLRGERGVTTGAAGAALVLVTWTVMGAVYGWVLRRETRER